jgi:RNA polymerase sigma factor (sigma-70 family)
MTDNRLTRAIQEVCQAALRGGAGLTDKQLLEHFIEHRDEAAFAALVRRHGPLVWGVCLRVIRHHHDAEDAFQATFLVLAQKATSVKPREMVANWLYGVAHRTALKAKAMAAKRRAREKQVQQVPDVEAPDEQPWRDLRHVIDQALAALPDKYRVPIILCELERKTGKEAARQLKIPEGTLATRLRTAKVMLSKRLMRRGLLLPAGSLAAALSQGGAAGAAPLALVSSTIKAAACCVTGSMATVPGLSANVVALTGGVLKMTSKLSVMAGTLLVGIAVGAGGMLYVPGTAARYGKNAPGAATEPAPSQPAAHVSRNARTSFATPSDENIFNAPAPEPEPDANLEVLHLAKTTTGWSVAVTSNFRLFHKLTRQKAEEIAQKAERTRAVIARKWFGAAEANWRRRCDLYVHDDASNLIGPPTGHSTMESKDGRVSSMRMDLFQKQKGMLTTVLPHEMTHVVLWTRFVRSPRWADEGMAILAEPSENVQALLGNLEKYRHENRLFSVRTLMQHLDYPQKDLKVFYAQSVSLVQFLMHEGGRKTLIQFLTDGREKGYEAAVREHYGWTMAVLEDKWREYAFDDIDD